jgi:hypothetical protein
MTSEKRQLERYNLSLLSRIQSTDDDNAVLVLETRDVCAGGAYFATRTSLPTGTPVSVEMVLPTARFQTLHDAVSQVLIQLDGIVLRSGPRGMAVRFGNKYRFHPAGRMASEMIPGQALARAG